MTAYEIRKRVKDLYELSGPYLYIYRMDEIENWENAFKHSEYDFTDGEISILKKFVQENWIDAEILLEDFTRLLCEQNSCYLEVWNSEHVFESCGYDLFILSFAIRDKSSNELIYSLHNKNERF